MAGFQGDVFFQAPRRFLDHRSSKQPTWCFIRRTGGAPGLGFAHGSDSLGPALGGPLTDYIIQFVATQGPNGSRSNLTASERTIYWPKYDTEDRRVLEILDDGFNFQIGNNTFRLEIIKHLTALTIGFPP